MSKVEFGSTSQVFTVQTTIPLKAIKAIPGVIDCCHISHRFPQTYSVYVNLYTTVSKIISEIERLAREDGDCECADPAIKVWVITSYGNYILAVCESKAAVHRWFKDYYPRMPLRYCKSSNSFHARGHGETLSAHCFSIYR